MRPGVPITAVSLAALLAVSAGPQVQAAESDTTIVVDVTDVRGPAMTDLLGVNHRYNSDGYGLWNVTKDAPYESVVDAGREVGIQSLRFPGGTIANTYDWKRAIGRDRKCQVDGRGSLATGFDAITSGLSFGPDEFMEYVDRVGAEPLIMVPFVTETPEDAADWVEYMNSPAGDPGNPNGGVDWADRRAADGHPAPYGVTRWEIGNEQQHLDSRHWLSEDTPTAAREYASGGSRTFLSEPLGKGCSHPVDGVPSDGSRRQVFDVVYPPVEPTLFRVDVDGRQWRQVDDLRASGPRARVFELRPSSGRVVFGNGVHGAVPRSGSTVLGSYVSVHEGYFDFAEAMKAVDPTIDVCASFGRIAFIDAAEGRPFDCLTTHPITSLAGPGEDHATWADALEGHDRMMLAADQRRRGILKLGRALPAGTPLWFTEAAAVDGDHAAFPTWGSSATEAAYMATGWGDWMELGIEFAMSSVFLGGNRALLGSRRSLTLSAEAITREAIGPMFKAGGDLLATAVQGNPVRQPEGMERSYNGLAVTATRDPEGAVQLLVVNRLPTDPVTARVQVDGQASVTAEVRTVENDGFQSSNKPDSPPEVTLAVTDEPVDAEGLVHTFPAASTTVIRLPAAP